LAAQAVADSDPGHQQRAAAGFALLTDANCAVLCIHFAKRVPAQGEHQVLAVVLRKQQVAALSESPVHTHTHLTTARATALAVASATPPVLHAAALASAMAVAMADLVELAVPCATAPSPQPLLAVAMLDAVASATAVATAAERNKQCASDRIQDLNMICEYGLSCMDANVVLSLSCKLSSAAGCNSKVWRWSIRTIIFSAEPAGMLPACQHMPTCSSSRLGSCAALATAHHLHPGLSLGLQQT
jgi:hypothetical protein